MTRLFRVANHVIKTGHLPTVAGMSFGPMQAPKGKPVFDRWSRVWKEHKLAQCFRGAEEAGEIPSKYTVAIKKYAKPYFYSAESAKVGEYFQPS